MSDPTPVGADDKSSAICQSCGAKNPEYAQFCYSCGAQQTQTLASVPAPPPLLLLLLRSTLESSCG